MRARFSFIRHCAAAAFSVGVFIAAVPPAQAADEPDLIFRKSTVFKLLTPNDKLATYAVDDPDIDGVACHFTVPERGGVKGWLGIAEEVSDISLACRQVGPVHFKAKFAQGGEVFVQLDLENRQIACWITSCCGTFGSGIVEQSPIGLTIDVDRLRFVHEGKMVTEDDLAVSLLTHLTQCDTPAPATA